MGSRPKAGKSWLRVLLFGDTDEGRTQKVPDEFDRPLRGVTRDMVSGGVSLPWTLLAAILVALSLMFTRVTLGAVGGMANADHLIGALALTVISISAAEVARAVRYALIPLGLALFITPFIYDAGGTQTVASIAAGVTLIALSIRRGSIRERYGASQPRIV